MFDLVSFIIANIGKQECFCIADDITQSGCWIVSMLELDWTGIR
jgi:hypothetical protein